MKHIFLVLFSVMGLVSQSFADAGTQDDAWLFWCRIAETGEKVSLKIPVDEENRHNTELAITRGEGDDQVTVLETKVHGVDFTVRSSRNKKQWINAMKVDLGRSGKVTFKVPKNDGPSQIVSTMLEFLYPQGVTAEYCSTFYTTGPKPIVTGGNR